MSRSGPIGRIVVHRTPPDYAFLHAATVSIRDVSQSEEIVAAGGGLSLERALSAAVGEALERYCLRSARVGREITAPAAALDGDFISPHSLLHYRDAVFSAPGVPLRPYAPEAALRWIAGRRLSDLRLVWVPVFAVFAGDREHSPGADPLDGVVSTGAACAHDRSTACLRGLYEVIERDAFTIHWENRWPGEPRALPPAAQALAETAARHGFTLHVRRLYSDTRVPVALAALVDETGRRAALGLGAAARANWELAAFRAAEEALLTSFWVSDMHRLFPTPIERVYDEMAQFPTPARHAYLYGFREMLGRAAFLWESPCPGAHDVQSIDTAGGAGAELRLLTQRIRAVGAEPVAIDITDDDVAGLGATVVRIVVPGFVPLARGIHARPLENPRLTTVPRAFGVSARVDRDFNTDPHPFP